MVEPLTPKRRTWNRARTTVGNVVRGKPNQNAFVVRGFCPKDSKLTRIDY